jgi:hypothetical protein
MARIEIADGQGKHLYFLPISVSSGTTELVAAVTGKKIVVVRHSVVVSTAGTVKFTDGTDDLTGAMAFAANGGITDHGQPSSPLAGRGVP